MSRNPFGAIRHRHDVHSDKRAEAIWRDICKQLTTEWGRVADEDIPDDMRETLRSLD